MVQEGRRRQARGEARRADILDAALRLVARGGPGALTMRGVAVEAGMPLGLVTYYFPSKDDLVAQAMERAASLMHDEFAPALEGLRGAGRERAVEAVTDLLLDILLGRPLDSVAQYELWLQAARRPALRGVARAQRAALLRQTEELLTGLGAPRAAADAPLLLAALDGLALQYVAVGRPPRATVRRQVARLLTLFTTAGEQPPESAGQRPARRPPRKDAP
jgi:DNA-binding transcriptional regulator YbjK